MSKTQQLATSRRVVIRDGEGVALDVITHQVKVSGQSVALMAIDASKAPVPDRKYVADFVAVDESKRGFRLVFGQRHPAALPGTASSNFDAQGVFADEHARKLAASG